MSFKDANDFDPKYLMTIFEQCHHNHQLSVVIYHILDICSF